MDMKENINSPGRTDIETGIQKLLKTIYSIPLET